MQTIRKTVGSLWGQTLLLAGVFVAYHFWLQWLMVSTGLKLGAVSQRLAPLYAYWRPHYKTGLLLAAAGMTGVVVWLMRRGLKEQTGRRPWWMGLVLVHWCLVPLVVCIDGKPLERLAEPYSKSDLEYIGAVPLVTTPGEFMAEYPRRLAEMPMHAQTHPPGAVLILWLVDRTLGPGPLTAAWFTILFSGLSIPAVFLLARRVTPESRLATVFYILAPNVILFTATSMEAVFAVPLIWSYCCFWQARFRRPLLWGAACGLCAAAAGLMTFSMAVLPLWGLLVWLLTAWLDRPRWKNTTLALVMSATVFVWFYVLLQWTTGYNILTMLNAAIGNHQQIMAGMNHHSWWQHGNLSLANLAVFLFSVGLPICLLWGRSLWQAGAVRHHQPDFAVFAWSGGLCLLLLAAAPLYTLEVERIWIFLVPLLAIPAAHTLQGWENSASTCRTLQSAFILLAMQTLLTEMLLTTYW